MNKFKLSALLAVMSLSVTTAAHASSIFVPDAIDAAHDAPNAVAASENVNHQYAVENVVPDGIKHSGVKDFGDAKQDLQLKNHYTGKFVSFDVGTHYDNEDTTIGGEVGTSWMGYEIVAGFTNGKYKAEGNGSQKTSQMIDETTYNASIWKPVLVGDSYDISLGGSLSRTIFDSDQTNGYLDGLGKAGAKANRSLTSTYLSLRTRSTVSESLGVYAEVNYNVWNNHDKFTSADKDDLHKPVTLKTGIDYTIVKGAQVGLNASIGTKFDTMYTASFKYSF